LPPGVLGLALAFAAVVVVLAVFVEPQPLTTTTASAASRQMVKPDNLRMTTNPRRCGTGLVQLCRHLLEPDREPAQIRSQGAMVAVDYRRGARVPRLISDRR
jgi:hypothetical protein